MNPVSGQQNQQAAPPPVPPSTPTGPGAGSAGTPPSRPPSFFENLLLKFQNNKKLFAIAGILFLVLAIPVSLTLVQSEQDIRQEAATNKKKNTNPNAIQNRINNRVDNRIKNNPNKNKTPAPNNKNDKNKGVQNFRLTCQPTQTINLAGSRKMNAIVRDAATNRPVSGRTVTWRITANPGGWIANVTQSSKTNAGGVAMATVRSNPAIISTAQGIITAQVQSSNNAVCRVTARNVQKAGVPPVDDPTPDPDDPTDPNDPDDPNDPGDGEGLPRTITIPVFIHGIGLGGDQANPGSEGNTAPLRTTRDISIQFFDGESLAAELTGTMDFDSTAGNFMGIVTGDIPVGSYTTIIHTPYSPAQDLPRSFSFDDSANITLPPITLFTGDANNDNVINILDYQIVLGCYEGVTTTPTDCDEARKVASDLDDNGIVDFIDLNLFIRELSTHKGAE